MLRGAAATEVLRIELERLSKASVQSSRVSRSTSRDMDKMSTSAAKADQSINQLTGRLRLFADAAAILGPALAPLGGVAVAGMAGLASQMGFAAIAGGVLIGSLQGLGTALTAMNKAELEPTTENIKKARTAFEALSPAAQEFANQARDLIPTIKAIRDAGAEALLPGLTASLDDLERLAPVVGGIFDALGTTMGEIAADSAASLASERWAGFFEFIRTEAPRAVSELAATVGDLVHGMAEMWEAFTPLNNDFSGWLMDIAASFDAWATGLDQTQGFQEFVDYIRTTGPQVADTLGALADAVVQIVQATAPLGGPVLAAIEGFAKAIGAIADSDLGTPIFAGIAALSLLNRTLAVTASLSKVSLSSGIFAGVGKIGKGAKSGSASIRGLSGDIGVLARNYKTAGAASERMAAQSAAARSKILGAGAAAGKAAGLIGGLALVTSGAADGLGVTNTASLALMGTLGGPAGVALGAAAGAVLDLKAAGEGATTAIRGLDAALASADTSTITAQIAAAKKELEDINNLDLNGGDILDRIGFQVADTFGGPSADEAEKKIRETEAALRELEAAQAEAAHNNAFTLHLQKVKVNLSAQRAEARKSAEAFVGLGDSLNDAKTSLGDWIQQLADQADALRNFRVNAEEAADKGLNKGLIASLRAAGPEGALRMRQLANASKEEIGKANDAWKSGQREIRKYVAATTEVPKSLGTTIKVNGVPEAVTNIDRIRNALAQVKDKTVTIRVTQAGTAAITPGFGPVPSADGSTVPKTGKPYADRHLYLLADGEEVISNRHGQADRHRSLLKDINAGRLADGGTTHKGDKRKPTGGLFVVDNTAALEEAIRRLTGVAEDQTEAVERATSKTEEWSAKMASVAQATVSGFNTGLFDKSSDPWAAGSGGGAVFNLNKDIAGLNERGTLQTQLAAMGLSGDALATLLGQGSNSDISGLIASGQVSQYADLYSQRAALQGSVGASAGQAAYGAQYAAAAEKQAAALAEQQKTTLQLIAANSRLERMAAALAAAADAPERTGAAVGAVVNGAAAGPVRTGRNTNPRRP